MAAADDEVLVHADEIYAPFSAEETKRLGGYVRRVDTLARLSFFTGAAPSFTVTASQTTPLTETTTGLDDEPLLAVIGLFRMLYGKEHTGFRAIMNLLDAHARQRTSSYQREALADIRGIKRMYRDVMATQEVAMVINRVSPEGTLKTSETWTNDRLIDLWLHGEFLHGENEKSAALDAWPLRGLALFQFAGLITRLAGVFCIGRNVVAEVLKHPELLDAP